MKAKINPIQKMWNKVKLEQWQKSIKVVLVCMIFMFVSELIFTTPFIADFFGEGLVNNQNGWMLYLIVWLIMFLQVAIIPIPALPILVACNQIPGLVGSSLGISGLFSLQGLFFICFITSATIIGAIASYWLGRVFGRPAIKWMAGSDSDYKKWSKKFNSKAGKWTYVTTLLLPIFPDDLISLTVGAVKMNFSFYVISNVICKFIGMYSMFLLMRMPLLNKFFTSSSSSVPVALIVYALILIGAIIAQTCIVRAIKLNQPKKFKFSEANNIVINKLKKKKSNYKDLIIDYDLNLNLKTYFATKIKIEKLYETNDKNEKEKVRIIIKYNISNYWQIVFDKTYLLTDNYDTLLDDIKNIGRV